MGAPGVLHAGPLLHYGGELAAGEVGERDVLEDRAQAGAERDPYVGQMRGRALVGQRFRPVSLHRGQWAFHGPEHVGDRDLPRRTGELVAAFGSAAGAYDPRPAELGEDVLEKILRDRLASGQ